LLRPLQDSYRAVEGRDRVHLLAAFADGHRSEVTESSAVSAPIVGVTAGVSALIVDDNLADTALYSIPLGQPSRGRLPLQDRHRVAVVGRHVHVLAVLTERHRGGEVQRSDSGACPAAIRVDTALWPRELGERSRRRVPLQHRDRVLATCRAIHVTPVWPAGPRAGLDDRSTVAALQAAATNTALWAGALSEPSRGRVPLQDRHGVAVERRHINVLGVFTERYRPGEVQRSAAGTPAHATRADTALWPRELGERPRKRVPWQDRHPAAVA